MVSLRPDDQAVTCSISPLLNAPHGKPGSHAGRAPDNHIDVYGSRKVVWTARRGAHSPAPVQRRRGCFGVPAAPERLRAGERAGELSVPNDLERALGAGARAAHRLLFKLHGNLFLGEGDVTILVELIELWRHRRTPRMPGTPTRIHNDFHLNIPLRVIYIVYMIPLNSTSSEDGRGMSRGEFRRRLEIATGPGIARAVVEDDFHHFRVEVQHERGVVRCVTGQAPRYPYTSCPMSAGALRELVGMSLSSDATAVRVHTDPLLQCTHLLDLAGLAIAAAARGIGRRRYDATVQDRIESRTSPTLMRDQQLVLAWEVAGDRIEGPRPYDGIGLRAGFVDWAIRTLAPEEAEAAIILRRALFVSGGRGRDLDAIATAPAKGGCYTQQPGRAPFALRVIGSTRDFSQRSRAAAAEDAAWLGCQARSD